jgi:Circadian oscillating protein COP23
MLRMPCLGRKLSPILLIGSILSIGSTPCVQAGQDRVNRKFSCERIDGIPTTVVKSVRGRIPMIRWVKSFSGRYHSVKQRCTEVSARLDRFNREGKLKFIRTGNVNTYPVLCVDTGVSGNTCPNTSVLVTLPKGTDSGQILQQMLDLRARASGRMINLNGGQLVRYQDGDAYVSIDQLLADEH